MNESKYYAGIGSRETPEDILLLMKKIAIRLSEMGYTLRSGHAGGADLAFESGATKAEIWLPWESFNKQHPRLDSHIHRVLDPRDQEALDSVARFHPMERKLPSAVQKLMARNYRQIVGGVNSPKDSEFVICWTKDGKFSGGTGQALRISESRKIKIYNLKNDRSWG